MPSDLFLSTAAPSVLAIVVLYRVSPEQSPAVQSLLRFLTANPVLSAGIRILLYDNSPEPHTAPAFAGSTLAYCYDASNGGLVVAYNYGLAAAVAGGIPWLLLLDQDTQPTEAYLLELLALLPVAADDQRIAAFVPKLTGLTGQRSPALDFLDSLRRQVMLPRWRRPLIAPADTYGAQTLRMMAFNSGAMLRTSALESIGGFPAAYWLDFLDMAVFHALYRQGFHVFVMHATLEHSLSVEAKDFLHQPGSLARHANILRAMIEYVRSSGTTWERLLHRGWLLRNSLSLVLRPGGVPFALESLRQMIVYSSGHQGPAARTNSTAHVETLPSGDR